MQLKLFPDPAPIVERLGREFFRTLPECAGVYFLRDERGTVLYVGKARNLRKRLAAYRVANPERLRRRTVRLLHSVRAIDWQICVDEAEALAREAQFLRELRPRFNRAGTWKPPVRFLAWRERQDSLQLAILEEAEVPEWNARPCRGIAAIWRPLVRVLWCAMNHERGLSGLPAGWFGGNLARAIEVPCASSGRDELGSIVFRLERLAQNDPAEFCTWARQQSIATLPPFERVARESDIQEVEDFFSR